MSVDDDPAPSYAIRHQVVTSGARTAAHLRYALRDIGKNYALGSACIGDCGAFAIVAEAVA
jgi:hypothetical protein